MNQTISWTSTTSCGKEQELSIPANEEACQVCQGKGLFDLPTRLVSLEEFTRWNLEEKEDYLRGGYDMECPECSGRGLVLVPADPDSELARQYLELDFARRERVWEESNSERYD